MYCAKNRLKLNEWADEVLLNAIKKKNEKIKY